MVVREGTSVREHRQGRRDSLRFVYYDGTYAGLRALSLAALSRAALTGLARTQATSGLGFRKQTEREKSGRGELHGFLD